MGMPVVTVAAGGLPVVESTNGFGAPVTEATNGRGTAVTKIVGGLGLPAIFVTEAGVVVPSTAAWDAATALNVTLSSGNLVVTSTAPATETGARVATVSGKTTGKYYFEITVTTWVSGGNTGFGVGTTASTYTNMGGNATTGVVYYVGTGNIWSNGGVAISLGTTGGSNTIGLAIDLDNRKSWFRNAPSGNWNNAVIGLQNPATNTGGITIPAGTMTIFSTFNASSNVFTANFGGSFVGAVPSGFTSGWPV